jgi:hypothetical protein
VILSVAYGAKNNYILRESNDSCSVIASKAKQSSLHSGYNHAFGLDRRGLRPRDDGDFSWVAVMIDLLMKPSHSRFPVFPILLVLVLIAVLVAAMVSIPEAPVKRVEEALPSEQFLRQQ